MFCSYFIFWDGFVHFQNGNMSIEDKPRSGCPSTTWINENVFKIQELVHTDWEISGLFWSAVQWIWTQDLGHGAMVMTQKQTNSGKQPRLEKFQAKSNTKTMLIYFFDTNVDAECLPGQMINPQILFGSFKIYFWFFVSCVFFVWKRAWKVNDLTA